MDWITVINTAVGLMSIVLGGFAIWLSLNLYTKAKEAETSTATALEAIKAQTDALQRLTARWMDRFTRHATEPKPADEGLMQLVHVVASLPTTILQSMDTVRTVPQHNPPQQLSRELVDAYVGLYYYTGLANVIAQTMMPHDQFDTKNELHIGVMSLIDRTAADFAHMAKIMSIQDQAQVKSSSLKQLLDEAIAEWRPKVMYTSQLLELRMNTPHGHAGDND